MDRLIPKLEVESNGKLHTATSNLYESNESPKLSTGNCLHHFVLLHKYTIQVLMNPSKKVDLYQPPDLQPPR